MRQALLETFRHAHRVLGGRGLLRYRPLQCAYRSVQRALTSLFRRRTSGLPAPVARVVVEGRELLTHADDAVWRMHLTTGFKEPYETALLKSHVRNGDVVVDLGAKIGYYTTIFAGIVGETGRVYAFEPDPDNFALLRRNVERHDLRNVILEQKAVSDRTGTTRLYLSDQNRGDHRILDHGDGRRAIDVEMVRLDDYFRGRDGRVDLVKMDIQGAEAHALQGMRGVAMQNPHLKIASEFWPFGLTRAGVAPRDYLEALLSLGFKLYEIDERANDTVPTDGETLLRAYRPEVERAETNIFCVR